MACLYNPDWIKTPDGAWNLSGSDYFGVVRPQITRDYSWKVFPATGGAEISAGVSVDRIAAFTAVEKILGYDFFIEPEYVASKGCRCGSCEDPTGKWRLWNREDTINLLFDTEGDAIAWVLDSHALASG